MAEPSFKERFLAAAAKPLGGADRMFELGDPPDYEPDPSTSIAARAAREGRDAARPRLRPLRPGRGPHVPLRPDHQLVRRHPRRRRRDARPPAHRPRPVRRRRPRRHDLRRQLPHHVPLLLGPRPRPGPPRPRLPRAPAHQGHRRDRRPARPRRARPGLPGRREPHRLRRPAACAAPRCATTCPPAASGSCSGPTATHTTIVKGQVTYQQRRAHRRPARAACSAAPQRRPPDDGPAVLEERCAWRSDEVGDDYVWELTDADRAELDAALEHAEAHTERHPRHHRRRLPAPHPRPAARRRGPRAHRRPRRGAHPRRARSTSSAPTARRPSTGGWARTSAGPGRRTTRATCSATSPTRARRATTPPAAATRSAAWPSRSTPTAPTSSGSSASNAGASGGASLVANAVSIHNELVRTAPDLAAALYDEFAYDIRGEEKAGSRPWYLMPVFTERGDRLFMRYIRPYILSARRHADAPAPIGGGHARRWTGSTPCAPTRSSTSRCSSSPGDMQFVNNYHVLHAREPTPTTATAGAVRHLKRLWLETDVLTDDDKPEAFRLTATTETWWKAARRAKPAGSRPDPPRPMDAAARAAHLLAAPPSRRAAPHAEPVGRRLGPAPRVPRLPGARPPRAAAPPRTLGGLDGIDGPRRRRSPTPAPSRPPPTSR